MSPRIETIAHGLIAIRANVDMLLSMIEPDGMPPMPESGQCEHLRREVDPSSRMGMVKYNCSDCGLPVDINGKEIEE